MEYYRFKEACATKETGSEYPQLQRWSPGYDDDNPNSYYSYYNASNRGSIFPDFTPDMDSLVLHNKAKLTDLLSSGLSIGFIISHKLKTIFEKYNFPSSKFYPTTIIHKKERLDSYYLMHIISNYYVDYLEWVDYNKSVFIVSGIANNNPEYVTLSSKEDYLEKSKQLQEEALISKTFRSIHAELICFNPKFDQTLDCFIAPFGIQYYISERLKDALIETAVTGCDIQQTNKLLFN